VKPDESFAAARFIAGAQQFRLEPEEFMGDSLQPFREANQLYNPGIL
jgi:hypothetical protein